MEIQSSRGGGHHADSAPEGASVATGAREQRGTAARSTTRPSLSRRRHHSYNEAPVSAVQHPHYVRAPSMPTIDLNPHSGDSASCSSFLRHRSSSMTSRPLSSSDPTSEAQQSPYGSSAPSMFSGYIEYTSGRIPTSSSPKAAAQSMRTPSASQQHPAAPRTSDPITIPAPVLSPPRSHASESERPASAAPPPQLCIPPSPSHSRQALSPTYAHSNAAPPSSASSQNLVRSPTPGNSHPMFFAIGAIDSICADPNPAESPPEAPREWWPYGAAVPPPDPAASIPRPRSAQIQPPDSPARNPTVFQAERQPSAPPLLSPFDLPPPPDLSPQATPHKVDPGSPTAPSPVLMQQQPAIPPAPLSLSAVTRSTAPSSTAGFGDVGRRSMPSFQSARSAHIDSTHLGFPNRSFQTGPPPAMQHGMRSEAGMVRSQSGSGVAMPRGESPRQPLPLGGSPSHGDPRGSVTMTEDGTGPLPTPSQCMAVWQQRPYLVDSTMRSQSLMPPAAPPDFPAAMPQPRYTLIRPGKSPVNKLQRQLLRRSSAGPLLTYALSAVFAAYIVIRATDAFWLFSHGRGVLASDRAPVITAAAGADAEAGVSFAREAAAEQEAAQQAAEAHEAWQPARDDVGGLVWRLLVILVEVLYGAAAVAWSAMATGAFSWVQNWKYRRTRARRPTAAMPTHIIAVLHIVDEMHAEAICAAALSHVEATAAARLPIKIVILHNHPRSFMDPLATLINAHITNTLFCSYGDLSDGSAARALFPIDGPGSVPGPAGDMPAGYVGRDWDIAAAAMAHDAALKTLVVQVAMGCARTGMQTALCAARASTVVSADDVWQALVHFQVTPVAHGVPAVQEAVARGVLPSDQGGSLPSMARSLLDQTLAPAAVGGFTVNPACFYMTSQDLLASMRHSGIDITSRLPRARPSTTPSQSGLLSGVVRVPSDSAVAHARLHGAGGSMGDEQAQQDAASGLFRKRTASASDQQRPEDLSGLRSLAALEAFLPPAPRGSNGSCELHTPPSCDPRKPCPPSRTSKLTWQLQTSLAAALLWDSVAAVALVAAAATPAAAPASLSPLVVAALIAYTALLLLLSTSTRHGVAWRRLPNACLHRMLAPALLPMCLQQAWPSGGNPGCAGGPGSKQDSVHRSGAAAAQAAADTFGVASGVTGLREPGPIDHTGKGPAVIAAHWHSHGFSVALRQARTVAPSRSMHSQPSRTSRASQPASASQQWPPSRSGSLAARSSQHGSQMRAGGRRSSVPHRSFLNAGTSPRFGVHGSLSRDRGHMGSRTAPTHGNLRPSTPDRPASISSYARRTASFHAHHPSGRFSGVSVSSDNMYRLPPSVAQPMYAGDTSSHMHSFEAKRPLERHSEEPSDTPAPGMLASSGTRLSSARFPSHSTSYEGTSKDVSIPPDATALDADHLHGVPSADAHAWESQGGPSPAAGHLRASSGAVPQRSSTSSAAGSTARQMNRHSSLPTSLTPDPASMDGSHSTTPRGSPQVRTVLNAPHGGVVTVFRAAHRQPSVPREGSGSSGPTRWRHHSSRSTTRTGGPLAESSMPQDESMLSLSGVRSGGGGGGGGRGPRGLARSRSAQRGSGANIMPGLPDMHSIQRSVGPGDALPRIVMAPDTESAEVVVSRRPLHVPATREPLDTLVEGSHERLSSAADEPDRTCWRPQMHGTQPSGMVALRSFGFSGSGSVSSSISGSLTSSLEEFSFSKRVNGTRQPRSAASRAPQSPQHAQHASSVALRARADGASRPATPHRDDSGVAAAIWDSLQSVPAGFPQATDDPSTSLAYLNKASGATNGSSELAESASHGVDAGSGDLMPREPAMMPVHRTSHWAPPQPLQPQQSAASALSLDSSMQPVSAVRSASSQVDTDVPGGSTRGSSPDAHLHNAALRRYGDRAPLLPPPGGAAAVAAAALLRRPRPGGDPYSSSDGTAAGPTTTYDGSSDRSPIDAGSIVLPPPPMALHHANPPGYLGARPFRGRRGPLSDPNASTSASPSPTTDPLAGASHDSAGPLLPPRRRPTLNLDANRSAIPPRGRPASPPPFPTMSTQSDGPSTPSFPAPPSHGSESIATGPSSGPTAADLFAGRHSMHELRGSSSRPVDVTKLPLPDVLNTSDSSAAAAVLNVTSARSAATDAGRGRLRDAHSSAIGASSSSVAPTGRESTDSLALPYRPHLTVLTTMLQPTHSPLLTHPAASAPPHPTTPMGAPVATHAHRRSMSGSSHASIARGGDAVNATGAPADMRGTMPERAVMAAAAANMQRIDSQHSLAASRSVPRSSSSHDADLLGTSPGSDAPTGVLMGVALPSARLHGAHPAEIPESTSLSRAYTFESVAVGAASCHALSASDSHAADRAGSRKSQSAGTAAAHAGHRFTGFPHATSFNARRHGDDGQPAVVHSVWEGSGVVEDGAGSAASWRAELPQHAELPQEGEVHSAAEMECTAVALVDEGGETPGHASNRSQMAAAMDHMAGNTAALPDSARPRGTVASSDDDSSTLADAKVPVWKAFATTATAAGQLLLAVAAAATGAAAVAAAPSLSAALRGGPWQALAVPLSAYVGLPPLRLLLAVWAPHRALRRAMCSHSMHLCVNAVTCVALLCIPVVAFGSNDV
eukprot:jgi/Ulvmu1/12386/UM009_0032.1